MHFIVMTFFIDLGNNFTALRALIVVSRACCLVHPMLWLFNLLPTHTARLSWYLLCCFHLVLIINSDK